MLSKTQRGSEGEREGTQLETRDYKERKEKVLLIRPFRNSVTECNSCWSNKKTAKGYIIVTRIYANRQKQGP